LKRFSFRRQNSKIGAPVGKVGLAAECLRRQIENPTIRAEILKMEWQVVTVPSTSDPILTSDVPLIINTGLRNDDGCLILPLSPNEFFVAYSLGKIDMKGEIAESVASGRFVRDEQVRYRASDRLRLRRGR
jgi:hypothetical protein